MKGYIKEIVIPDARCKIRLIQRNVLAHADDIDLMSPSLEGLWQSIDILGDPF